MNEFSFFAEKLQKTHHILPPILRNPNSKSSPMSMLSFKLHLPPPIKHQQFPHAPHLKITPHARPPSASTVNGANDVVVRNSSPPALEDPVHLSPILQKELMPRHVAIIMDGNRRWARNRGFTQGSGYEAGARALRKIVELCCKWRITVLTVFAFSADNWLRPRVETDLLMRLFERGLRDELKHFGRENVRISLIGDSTKLPKPLQVLLANTVETTKKNTRLHLIVAINYSGQNDVVQACQKLALKVKDGLIEPEDIDEFSIENELETNCADFPNPDLLIRTSGELRISNFLLWQLAYTELYFTNSLWPDFGEDEFLEALSSFQQRQRRFGRRSS